MFLEREGDFFEIKEIKKQCGRTFKIFKKCFLLNLLLLKVKHKEKGKGKLKNKILQLNFKIL